MRPSPAPPPVPLVPMPPAPPATSTIAAIATGLGGGIAIIRLSGPAARTLAAAVWRPLRPAPWRARRLVLGTVLDAAGRPADQCLAVLMPGPHSYTGEDVVELHCHGGTLVARTVMGLLLAAGAQPAAPGEFTRRAFLNGRLDLTQAEAVLEVIEAHSELALRAAHRQLTGALKTRVEQLHAALVAILAELESRLDFVDENLDWTARPAVAASLQAVATDLAALLAQRQAGEVLREGLRLVLAGAPNAGKSSLLNLLVGRERAIVTPIPGTTRDLLEEPAHLRGIPVRLIDTAGLHDRPADEVEAIGMARGVEAIRGARLVLWVVDATRPAAEQTLDPAWLSGKDLLVVLNKSDLAPAATPPALAPGVPVIRLCAHTGAGLPALLDAIERQVWGGPLTAEPEVTVSARHAAELDRATTAIQAAIALVGDEHDELTAVHLRAALDALGRITGRTLQPDLLDHIFAKFCIGK